MPSPEPLLAKLSGGPLDGATWIFNHDKDVPTLDPAVTWKVQPEPMVWPLPDVLATSAVGGKYVKESESQTPKRLPNVIRGASYAWTEDE